MSENSPKNTRELHGKELISQLVEELEKTLKPNEIFLSEDDLKFSLGWLIHEKLGKDSNVILEYPIYTKYLYDSEDDDGTEADEDSDKKRRCYIDVYFEHKEKGTDYKYFIELKFVTNKADCSRHGMGFELRNHSAINFRLYTIYKDIERMEKIRTVKDLGFSEENVKSYVLVITNQEYLWLQNGGVSENYPLIDMKANAEANAKKKRKIRTVRKTCDDKTNNEKTFITSVKDYQGEGKKPNNSDAPRYTPDMEIKNRYIVKWEDFKSLTGEGNVQFRYLLIDLTAPCKYDQQRRL